MRNAWIPQPPERCPLLLIPEYSGINKGQRVPERSKTAHRKPLVKCFLMYFCFIDYAKALDSVDHNKLGKILKEMGIPDHLTCLLRNLYEGQEVKKEFIGPGLHLRPICADHAWLPLQWTLNSLLRACGNDNERIRPPPDRGILKITSRLLIA